MQALLWASTLVALPWLIEASDRLVWLFLAGCSVIAVSYGFLWSSLGAGRHLADWLTLARFVALLVVAVLIAHQGEVTWLGFAACVAIVCADLLDGYCARRLGGSAGGAVLDMETDQFATVVLATLIYSVAGGSVWVLVIPGYRYGYVLLLGLIRLPTHDPKPRDGDNRLAKYACAAVMGLLLLALVPGIESTLRVASTAVAATLLALSYGVDTAFLLRQRARG